MHVWRVCSHGPPSFFSPSFSHPAPLVTNVLSLHKKHETLTMSSSYRTWQPQEDLQHYLSSWHQEVKDGEEFAWVHSDPGLMTQKHIELAPCLCLWGRQLHKPCKPCPVHASGQKSGEAVRREVLICTRPLESPGPRGFQSQVAGSPCRSCQSHAPDAPTSV